MDAVDKTKALKRVDLPVSQLVKQENNPNKMSKRGFDLLVDNIQRTGLSDPILVRPLNGSDGKMTYRIVGGHHRFDAAVYLGFEEVPCTIIDHDDFDADAEMFQIVRMNVIHGKLDPAAFLNMYQEVAEKYSDDILQDMFGFAETAEFQKLINQTAKSLPTKELQDKFKEAAKEIKTIDGLSKLLNQMFSKYGDTLPYGFMVLDHGGQRNVWLQISSKTLKAIDMIGDMCIDHSHTMDDVVGAIVQSIAKGEFKEQMEKIMAAAPTVVLPANLQAAPTKENLKALAEVDK